MASDITVKQLQALLAVMEARGFTRAATRLGSSQAGISQSIAGLERVLGAPVLVRKHGAVSPTELGEVVAREAGLVLQSLERVREAADEAAGIWAGRLRIALSPGTAGVVAALLRSFRRQHADAEVELLEGSDEQVCEWVRERRAEVGLTGGRAEGLDAWSVAEDELVLVVPSLHRLARLGPLAVRELAGESFLLLSGSGEAPVRAVLDGAGTAVRLTMRVHDISSLLALVREGLGVTIVPEMALPEPLQGVRVRRFVPPARRMVQLVWPVETPLSRLVTDFVELARATRPPQPAE